MKKYRYFIVHLNVEKDAGLIEWLLQEREACSSPARAVKRFLYRLMKEKCKGESK